MKFEACLPENFEKPNPDASTAQRTDFIRKKYEQNLFVKPDSSPISPISFLPTSRSGSGNTMLDMRQEKHSTVQRIHDKFHGKFHGKFHALHHRLRRSGHREAKKSHSMAGMVEFLGLIKVNVVRGTNLVVRDISSSDPYVVLSLGNQTVRTHVIKKNLNPVWNEQLMLSIPENVPPLKIVPYHIERDSPSYFIVAGLVFTPLSEPLIEGESEDNLGLRLLTKARYSMAKFKGEQIVVLSQVLANEVNIGYEDKGNDQVLKLNGISIKSIHHLAHPVDSCKHKYLVFEFEDNFLLVLEREAAIAASTRILKDYGIPSDKSSDLTIPYAEEKFHHLISLAIDGLN